MFMHHPVYMSVSDQLIIFSTILLFCMWERVKIIIFQGIVALAASFLGRYFIDFFVIDIILYVNIVIDHGGYTDYP